MIADVLYVEDESRPNASDGRSHGRPKQWRHDKYKKEDQVIQRPNAQRPASVEIPEIMGRPLRIQKYSGDEKARQNKEYVHGKSHIFHHSRVRQALNKGSGVTNENQNNRSSPETVKLGYISGNEERCCDRYLFHNLGNQIPS